MNKTIKTIMAIKTIKAILSVLLPASMMAVASSCTEQTPDEFQNITGVYFNNRSNTSVLQDTTNVTFVYEKGDEMEVPVTIQLLGRPSDQPRSVALTVASDNAVKGTDYTLPETAEIAAGETTLSYIVTLKRTQALKTQSKSLTLTLHENEHFALPVTSEVTASGDTVTTLSYRIIFSDTFTSAPEAWEKELLGTFSQQKFELICDVLDIDPADFNDDSAMTLAMQAYICSEMTSYVSQQKALKDAGEAYDANAFDSTGAPLSFTE